MDDLSREPMATLVFASYLTGMLAVTGIALCSGHYAVMFIVRLAAELLFGHEEEDISRLTAFLTAAITAPMCLTAFLTLVLSSVGTLNNASPDGQRKMKHSKSTWAVLSVRTAFQALFLLAGVGVCAVGTLTIEHVLHKHEILGSCTSSKA